MLFTYQYSRLVDPAAYDGQGLCDGIPLRVHRNQILEDLGYIRAQEDWRKYIAPIGNAKGLLGPEYNIVSTMFPFPRPSPSASRCCRILTSLSACTTM